ncbi:hypothetical protein ACOMHN_050222 [Nucella lapillus]
MSKTRRRHNEPAFHQARLPCGAIAQTVAWSAPRSMALHSITASQCAFTQPPPADGPAFPPATSRPAVGSGQRPPSHPSILPNFLPLTVCCPLSHRWAVNPVTPLHSRLHHRCSRVVNPATPLLSRLHHHCRRAVNPLPWHSRLHHRRRRVVNLAMPLDSRPHHQHCCCVLVTLL